MGATIVSTEAQQNTVPPELLLDPAADNSAQPDPAQSPPASSPEDDIPEQFRGKSPSELVKIIRDSQSEIGRARNEIGAVRRLADELLGIQRVGAAKPAQDVNVPQRKPLTTDALLHDPEAAVVELVRSEARARELAGEDRVARLEGELQLTRFEAKHPGYRDTITTPEFLEWVQKSGLRIGLAQAAQQGNFAAADELLTLFNESRPAASHDPSSPTDKARQAGLVRSGGPAASAAASPALDRQVWSREKLLELRIKDPDQFDRLWPQIEKAYKEKRVR